VRNVTLTMDDELIEKGREYARRHGISFNALIRDLLRKRITQESDWVGESFRAMDAAGGRSGGRRFGRDELYDA
jgi:plasmid stability protein